MKKHSFSFMLIMFFFVTSIFTFPHAASSDDNNSPITLRIGAIKVLSGLPTFVAIEENYFHKVGINPKLIFFKSSDLAFNALKADVVDMIGVSGTSQCLRLVEDHADILKIIGLLYSSTCIIAPIDSNVDRVGQIKCNKKCRVGVFPGSVFSTYARQALISAGTNIDNMDFVPYPPSLQVHALSDRKIDYLYTLEPFCAIAAGERIGKYLTNEDLFAKHFLNSKKFPGGVVALSTKFEKKYGTNRIFRAYNLAMKTINSKSFNKNIYLKKYTAIQETYFPYLKFEGAAFGNEIETTPLNNLIGKLVNWKLLSRNIDINKIVAK